MAGVLERAHPLQRDSAADVDVRRGDVDAELDPQRPAELQLLLEPAGRQDVDGVAGQVFDHGPPIVPTCARGDLVRRGAAAESERELDLVAEELEHPARAGFPVAGKAPERRTAGQDRARTERERLDDVRPSPDAAVHVDLDPAGDGLDDLRQQLGRRRDGVELPAAVVRDDDRVDAVLRRRAPRPRRSGSP